MRPSDIKKSQGLKPTKPINTNAQKMLENMDEAIDKPTNWQPKGNHPDKKNFNFNR